MVTSICVDFFAVSDDVRSGYQTIRGTVELTSSASEEQLQTLREIVNTHCPVLDILSNPVPIDLELRVTEAVTN
ncbi:MAG: OsmC family protein [Alphaproteobacteria bacterium]